MFTKVFWADATERALSTAAQFAIVAIGADATNLLNMNVVLVLGAAGAGAVVSYLKSIAAATLTGTPNGSLIK